MRSTRATRSSRSVVGGTGKHRREQLEEELLVKVLTRVLLTRSDSEDRDDLQTERKLN